MGGTTLKCNVCNEVIRICSVSELRMFQEEHNENGCEGKYESIWKNYDKIPNEEKEKLMKMVMFRYGRLTYKNSEIDTKTKERFG